MYFFCCAALWLGHTHVQTTLLHPPFPVAMYNMGNYIRARRSLKALLEDHPDFR